MRHRVFRSLAMLVTLVLTISGLAPVAFFSPSISAQGTDPNTWENETYGFSIGWTDDWAVDADQISSVVSGGDLLRLTSADASLTLRAEPADLDANERLQQELDHVIYLNGSKAEVTSESDDLASAEWRSDSLSRLVAVIGLDSGEANLVVTLVADAASFDDAIASAGENVTVDDAGLLGGSVRAIDEPTEKPDEEETPDLKLPTQEPLGDGVDGNSYSSPSFGYSFEWGSSWEVAEDGEYSEEGYDVLNLIGEFGGLTIYAFEDYEGDAAACLEGEAEYNESDAGIEDWEPAEDADGDPIAGETDDSAYAVYTATLLDSENEDAPGRSVAVYLECRELGGDAVLGISAFSLKNLYNDHIDEVLEVTETITLFDENPSAATEEEAAPEETPEDIPDDAREGNGEDANAPAGSDDSAATPEATDRVDTGDGESAIDGSVFTSPGFGFTLDIPATWSVEDETIADGDEHLVLSNGTSTVTVWATTEFGDAGLTGCVTFASEASGLDLEVGIRNDGSSFQGSDDLEAYSAFVYTDGDVERTYFVKCSWIETDESALIVIQDVPTDDYASERRARRQIENSIDVP